MRIWRALGWSAAGFAVAVSLINASWLAPRLAKPLILVAHRGVAQQFDHEGIADDTCTAERMLPSEHDFIDNTLRSFSNARHFGADAIALEVQPTKDGQVVAYHDWTVDCRTEGHGAVRELTLAQLKKLDVGYGYTPDRGRTFPLRGKGVGGMPTVEEVLREVPRMRLIFHFKSRSPGDADALVAALRRGGADPAEARFGYYGDPAVVRRVRQLAPGAWAFSVEETKACLADYVKFGWTSYVPQSCRDTTVMVPLNYQWAIWGWPKRFLARMDGAGTRVILTGDYRKGGALGLTRAEQLAKVPRDFRGYLWIEDFYAVGRALER
jgi:glycerophosphoryl diester phosphodiesterase